MAATRAIQLTRAGETVSLSVNGRILSIEGSSGDSSDAAYFDEAAVLAAFDVRVDELLAAGWEEHPDSLRRRHEHQAAVAKAEATRAQHVAFAEQPDVRGAVRALIPWLDDETLQTVSAIEAPDARGFVVRFTGGGAMECARSLDEPVARFWLYVDEDAYERNEHALYFGDDAAPPEPPDELDGVDWFLEEAGRDCFWFTRAETSDEAHAWEFDGGLRAGSWPVHKVLREAVARCFRG